MTKYQVNQEVEVAYAAMKMGNSPTAKSRWIRAKITALWSGPRHTQSGIVELPDGIRVTFTAEHIRPVA